MDKIKKLLRKIAQSDRARIEGFIEKILCRDVKHLDRKKMKSKNIYRVRMGNYRIIYYDDKKDVIILRVRHRNESTYKNM